jgi:divalent metal cation (Fe/Co/Zn/Cd) transporter
MTSISFNYLASMHLVMAGDSRVEEAHRVCDHLELEIKQNIPGQP